MILILLVVLALANALDNFKECKEINTFGYKYEAFYKIPSDRIEFYVKAVSDAHIVLLSNLNALDEERTLYGMKTYEVVEVVIGGGKNSFSAIRLGAMGGRKFTKIQINTPDILSDDEYRGFWISIKSEYSDSSISVGEMGNGTAFMTAEAGDFRREITFKALYFGISTWNHVKGKWRIGCSNQTSSGIEEASETNNVTGVLKLKKDLLNFYESNHQPPNENGGTFEVEIAMHLFRFRVDEKTSTVAMFGKLFLKWKDSRLEWDPSQYENLTTFRNNYAIWTPPLEFFGSLVGATKVDFESPVFVNHRGNVTWLPKFDVSSLCDLEVSNWPNDEYSCHFLLNLQPYIQSETKISIILGPLSNWQYNISDSEWDLHVTNFVDTITDDSERDYLFLILTFKRKNQNYKVLFAIPFICIGIIMLASLMLPTNHQGKLYLGCLVLVLLTVRMLSIVQVIPSNTLSVPPLVNMYLLGLILTCFSILMFVLVKNMSQFNCRLPTWCHQIITSQTFEILICFDASTVDPTLYGKIETNENSREKPKEWVLICVALERLFFVIYLITYGSVWMSFMLN